MEREISLLMLLNDEEAMVKNLNYEIEKLESFNQSYEENKFEGVKELHSKLIKECRKNIKICKSNLATTRQNIKNYFKSNLK